MPILTLGFDATESLHPADVNHIGPTLGGKWHPGRDHDQIVFLNKLAFGQDPMNEIHPLIGVPLERDFKRFCSPHKGQLANDSIVVGEGEEGYAGPMARDGARGSAASREAYDC